MTKRPFDIEAVLARVGEAIRPFPKAALFDLADRGYTSVFEQLVACIISVRTRDEVTLPAALKLFGRARTPGEMSRLSPGEIATLIGPSSFREAKASQLHQLSTRVVAELSGELPCDEEVLLGFRGVGPKCANLVLGIACDQAKVSVDVHVWRVTHRWGYVEAGTPEQATPALEAKLPPRFHLAINRLLVPFGKHICTGRLPRCSECPVLEWCRQVDVTAHR